MDTTQTVAPATKPEPTSEKLTAIRAEITKLEDIQITWTKATPRDERLKLNLELFKLGNDEKAEIANIEKSDREAKTMEARNAKIAIVDNLIAAAVANHIAASDKKLSLDEKNAAYKAQGDLRETIINSILGSKPTPTATATGDKPAGTKGATGQEIVDLYDKYRAEGKSDKEARDAIKAAGHSRGTTDAVILAAKGPVDKR